MGEYHSCPFAKMMLPWGDNFDKRTALYLLCSADCIEGPACIFHYDRGWQVRFIHNEKHVPSETDGTKGNLQSWNKLGFFLKSSSKMSQIKETHQRFQTPLIIHKSNLKHISNTAKLSTTKIENHGLKLNDTLMMNISIVYSFFLTFLAIVCKITYMPNVKTVTNAIALHEVARNDWV